MEFKRNMESYDELPDTSRTHNSIQMQSQEPTYMTLVITKESGGSFHFQVDVDQVEQGLTVAELKKLLQPKADCDIFDLTFENQTPLKPGDKLSDLKLGHMDTLCLTPLDDVELQVDSQPRSHQVRTEGFQLLAQL